MSRSYLVEPLSAAKHRRDEFSCESPELTEFLRTRARKEMQARASACFVLVAISDPGKIAGYYTLSATTICLSEIPPELAKRFPRYPNLPATLLGRLARDSAFRGAGLGDYLLTDALQRAFNNTVVIGSVAVVTDPKDKKAGAFYQQYGFRAGGAAGGRLMLPMAEIAASLQQGGIR
jgi:GNAT superfamily N-acetyltransferase